MAMECCKRPPGTVFIAMSGKKQVGKDTATTIMKTMLETAGLQVTTTAFAEPLKEMCINILGLKRELVYGSNDDKNTPSSILWDGFSMDIRLKYSNETDDDGRDWPRSGPMTVREVLQVMGTDVFRAIYDDVWANAPFNRDWSDYDVVIITDCRFPNEKRVTETRGGAVVRLERNTGYVDNHPSETALDGATFDPRFYYQNNGTLDELTAFARSVLENLNLIKPNG